MVLWAAGLDGINRDDVVIELPQRRYAQGSPLRFTAAARQPGGQPFTNAEFTVDLLKPDGQQRAVIVSDQGDVREVSLPE